MEESADCQPLFIVSDRLPKTKLLSSSFRDSEMVRGAIEQDWLRKISITSNTFFLGRELDKMHHEDKRTWKTSSPQFFFFHDQQASLRCYSAAATTHFQVVSRVHYAECQRDYKNENLGLFL